MDVVEADIRNPVVLLEEIAALERRSRRAETPPPDVRVRRLLGIAHKPASSGSSAPAAVKQRRQPLEADQSAASGASKKPLVVGATAKWPMPKRAPPGLPAPLVLLPAVSDPAIVVIDKVTPPQAASGATPRPRGSVEETPAEASASGGASFLDNDAESDSQTDSCAADYDRISSPKNTRSFRFMSWEHRLGMDCRSRYVAVFFWGARRMKPPVGGHRFHTGFIPLVLCLV